MENPQGVNVEPLKPPVRPIIEYDPSLQEKDVPYSVNVDGEKCAELFHELGISDEAIRKLKIELTRKPMFSRGSVGSYTSIGGDRITIYTDVLWEKLKDQKKKKFPLRKGIALVKKMSGGEFETSVGIFLHESKHTSDFKGKVTKVLGTGGFQFAYYLGGVIGVGVAIASIPITPLNVLLSPLAVFSIPVLYAANPYEIRARRFASKNRNDPRWQDILTITPKPKQ